MGTADTSLGLGNFAQVPAAAERLGSGVAGQTRARVGEISFVNCLPVTLPLQQGLVSLDGDVTFAAPSVLNKMFAAGQLDAGAMSSFYYISQSEQLELLPEIAISCTGPVGSVLFFSKRELKDLRTARIVVSAQSATSVNLLKLLLWKELDVGVRLSSDDKPDLDSPDVDAALVIGDRALEVDAAWSSRYSRRDLGQWWVETYDAPMVYGVWAASRSWADEHPESFFKLCQAHISAREIGMQNDFAQVIDEAMTRTKLSRERLQKYFSSELDFRLTADHLRGLELYRRLCLQRGLL